MTSNQERPCPICFELPPDSIADDPAEWRARYTEVRNHSWNNRGICDAHGICKGCLARHIEVQVHEGRWNIRCPGEGCSYHLLHQDVEGALQETDGAVLQRLECLRSQSCQGRLREIVHATDDDEARSWLLGECQPCPECFVVARRESGCNHVVCRCGCDFCARCGAPSRGLDPHCLCPLLDFDGSVCFAAWLRASWASPCEWLWQLEDGPAPDEWARFSATLGFLLWRAGAAIDPPRGPCPLLDWGGVTGAVAGDGRDARPPLAPLKFLKWTSDPSDDPWPYAYDFLFDGSITDEDEIHWEDQRDLAGHLRKEIYSPDSRRALRRRARRPAPGLRAPGSGDDDAAGGLAPAGGHRKPRAPRREKVRRWRCQVVAAGAF